MQKVGRNDPCPCGSGKKYKKCCEEKVKHKKFEATVLSHAPEQVQSATEVSKVSNLFFKRPASAAPTPPPDSPSEPLNPVM